MDSIPAWKPTPEETKANLKPPVYDGRQLMLALAKAANIPWGRISRMVLELTPDDMPRLYVACQLSEPDPGDPLPLPDMEVVELGPNERLEINDKAEITRHPGSAGSGGPA